MYRQNRHRNVTSIELQEFTGGLNYLLPADLLKPNECTILDNLVYDPVSGILSTRPSFRLIHKLSNVRGAYFTNNVIYIIAGSSLYTCINETVTEQATGIDGLSPIVRFAEWDDGLLIAAGGDLNYYKNYALTKTTAKDVLNANINADHVFVRAGRVILARTGSDTLYYSGIANHTNWTYGSNAADAKYIEIGYKDGGDIAAILNLSQDVIIFKTNGNIYRLIGEYPEWQCVEISRGLPCIKGSALSHFNSAIFLTTQGIMALDTVQAYGDIQVRNGIGAKINKALINLLMGQTATISYSPLMGSLFVNISARDEVFVMSATYGAFTKWQLPFIPVTCGDTEGKSWYIGTNGLYLADYGNAEDIIDYEETADDNNNPITVSITSEISSYLKTKTFRNPYEWLVKRILVGAKPLQKGVATIRIDRLEHTIETGTDSHVAFTDDDFVYSDIEPLVNTTWQDFKFTDVWRGRDLIVEVIGKGRICVKLYIDVAQIG